MANNPRAGGHGGIASPCHVGRSWPAAPHHYHWVEWTAAKNDDH